ncbi:KNOTTED1-like homeobox gene 3 [Hibiscus trionum]|uniref:KNOTTED1-like homeobox gene 3 n=1 Tax=Hibiscus trionum TaxID=183268 RepID=A0A9W7M9L3_HIBTR|nr:KNOTTED1-like homeobox gene 3 [Hibiscus trionum]
MAFHPNHLSQDLPLHHFTDQQEANQLAETSAPSWLNTALLRSQQPQPPQPHAHFPDPNFLNLHSHTTINASESTSASQAPNQWLSRSSSSLLLHNHGDDVDEMAAAAATAGGGVDRESMVAVESGELKRRKSELNNNNEGEGIAVEIGGGGDGAVNWQNARYKAEILSHPLYEQLLSAHVSCLRIATPVDQLPRIDAQLAQSQQVVAKYSALGGGAQGLVGGEKELDQFMTHYVMLLCSFKEQLQQHVRVHAMEAVMACWEIEQSLQSLTGVSPGEGTGATMSDDDDDRVDTDANLFDASLDGPDSMGFGPLVPTESERSLMERVRQELKHELKQGYKEKIVDIREEILRKRRAGKLPGDTTSVLKAWWQSHSKWPYPTEEDKERLVRETGLQLKQINNWFINQRKRNWHSNPSTSTVSKNKRKK